MSSRVHASSPLRRRRPTEAHASNSASAVRHGGRRRGRALLGETPPPRRRPGDRQLDCVRAYERRARRAARRRRARPTRIVTAVEPSRRLFTQYIADAPAQSGLGFGVPRGRPAPRARPRPLARRVSSNTPQRTGGTGRAGSSATTSALAPPPPPRQTDGAPGASTRQPARARQRWRAARKRTRATQLRRVADKPSPERALCRRGGVQVGRKRRLRRPSRCSSHSPETVRSPAPARGGRPAGRVSLGN